MIGELIDRAISWVSPGAAARRVHSRRIYNQVSRRSYEAAKQDRLTSHWSTSNKSADLWLLSDADKIRGRARDLCANNAYARGIVRAIVRNVVGQGIRPQAKTENETFNKAAEQLWQRFALCADATGQLTFFDIQRLALKEVKEAGEVLLHFVEMREDRSRPLPLAIEMIDIDRLASDEMFPRQINQETGNIVRRGVEVDQFGRPVAYWIYPSHPNDLHTFSVRPERFPADNFLHLFKKERVGQTRGVSEFAPIIIWLKQLGFYVENELQASAVASCFTAAITTHAGAADGALVDTIDSDSNDEDGNQFEYLQPALVARLMPGESIETINPSRPNAQAEPWINLMLRSMAVGTGLSYERLVRDYSQTTYSSNRAADLEDRREFRPEQDWLIARLCMPVWRRFIESAVLANAQGFPSESELIGNYDFWTDHNWQPPGWEWVDPVKEAKASEIAIQANLSTLQDELGVRGKDLRETLEKRRREMDLTTEIIGPEEPEEADVEVPQTPA